MTKRALVVLAMIGACWPAAAAAQAPQEPISPFAADVRVALPRFKSDVSIAEAIDVASENLPTRGFGVIAGVHVYPVRSRRVALGVGGEMLISGASKTLEPEEEDGVAGPTVDTRFSVLSPHVSLNFGGRNGWSYISGGFGLVSYTSERQDAPVADADGRSTGIHYGGGARWFAKDHLAFALDLRFYTVPAQEASASRPPYPKMRLMVISAGVSFK